MTETFPNSGGGTTQLPSPISLNHSFSIRLYPYISRCVVVLLGRCRPIAVLGAIIAITVASFDAMFVGRLRSHIEQKVIKVSPSVADADALFNVMFPVGVIRVCASLDHSRPSVVLGRSSLGSSGIPSLPVVGTAPFTARPCCSGREVPPRRASRIPAVAYPVPVVRLLSYMTESCDSDFSESSTSDIVTKLVFHNNPFRYTLEDVEAGCKSYNGSGMTLASEQYCHTGDPYVN